MKFFPAFLALWALAFPPRGAGREEAGSQSPAIPLEAPGEKPSPLQPAGDRPQPSAPPAERERPLAPFEERLRAAERAMSQSLGEAERAAIERSLKAGGEGAAAGRAAESKIILYSQLPKIIQKKAEAVYTVSLTVFLKAEGEGGQQELWRARAAATGFLIDPFILATAAHAIKIMDEDLISADINDLHGAPALKAKKVLAVSEELDLALVEVESLGPAALPAGLELKSAGAKKGDRIYGLGYPAGAGLTAFEGAVYELYQNELVFRFESEPALDGMSGAPIFSEDGEVLGVYKSGLYKYQDTKSALHRDQGMYIHSEATGAAGLKELLQEAKQMLKNQKKPLSPPPSAPPSSSRSSKGSSKGRSKAPSPLSSSESAP